MSSYRVMRFQTLKNRLNFACEHGIFAETVKNNSCIETFLSRFANPNHWLKYFPPVAKADLKSLGVKVTGISIHMYMVAIL